MYPVPLCNHPVRFERSSSEILKIHSTPAKFNLVDVSNIFYFYFSAQLSMKRSSSASAATGHIPDYASAPCLPIVLKHDEISMEPYTGVPLQISSWYYLIRDSLVCSSLCRPWV